MKEVILKAIADSYKIPADFVKNCSIVERERIAAPFYSVDYRWDVNWTASFGYDRREYYTVYENRTSHQSDGRIRHYKEAVEKSRTVTDWHPVSGRDSGSRYHNVYAGNQLPSEAISVLENANLQDYSVETNFDDCILAQHAHKFTSNFNELRGLVDTKISRTIDHSVRQYEQGDHSRGWSWNGNISLGDISPCFAVICRYGVIYNDKEWTFWMDGTKRDYNLVQELPTDERISTSIMENYIPFCIVALTSIVAIGSYNTIWTWAGALSVCAICWWVGYDLSEKLKNNHKKLVGEIASERVLMLSNDRSE